MKNSSASSLPVMIFIPGGNFQYLDASIPVYEAEHLVNTTGVVVALIQYRLGKYTILIIYLHLLSTIQRCTWFSCNGNKAGRYQRQLWYT